MDGQGKGKGWDDNPSHLTRAKLSSIQLDLNTSGMFVNLFIYLFIFFISFFFINRNKKLVCVAKNK